MEHEADVEHSEPKRSATRFLIVIIVLAVAAGMYALPSCRGGQADGGHLRALTSEEFDDAVASGVVLVDFWAPWCGPCRQQTPILEQVARRVDGRAVVMKVNVDDQGDLAERFDVRSIPTLILLRDGRPVERFVGVQNAETLIDAIDSAAETDAP